MPSVVYDLVWEGEEYFVSANEHFCWLEVKERCTVGAHDGQKGKIGGDHMLVYS